jgi:hypothetical protein
MEIIKELRNELLFKPTGHNAYKVINNDVFNLKIQVILLNVDLKITYTG